LTTPRTNSKRGVKTANTISEGAYNMAETGTEFEQQENRGKMAAADLKAVEG